MSRLSTASILLAAMCCGVAALNENIDIDIKVDTDSKLYHQGKTVEGSFNYGYNVPRQNYNQYQHKVKGPDGVTYGCYGFVDPTNGTHLYHYVSDLKGYRVVPPNRPTRVYTERVANSVANIYDSVGVEYDWEKLYFPDVCRVLQKSKEQRNELSIPPGYRVNDDGSVTQTTTQGPKPVQTTTRRAPPPPPPSTTPRANLQPTRPALPAGPVPTRPTPRAGPAPTRPAPPTPRATPRPTTRATPRPTPAQPRVPPTPARDPPRREPTTTRPPVRTAPTTTRPTVPPRTTPRATSSPPTRPSPPRTAAPTPPRPQVPKQPSPTPAKTNGNKFGTNRDNFIGSPTVDTVEKLVPPGQVPDLNAVGQNINELRTLLQMLLKTLNSKPKAAEGPDCDPGLGAVDPNAKHVFLPLVIVDSLPGAPRGAAGGAAAGVPPGSQFALPAVGYGAQRCNTCG